MSCFKILGFWQRVAAVLMVCSASCFAASPLLKPGDTVAITGDSITEQKQYSVFMEEYLLMCKPAANLRTMQFGWGGERSWGFLARIDNDCLQFKPNVATTCFGMNDGGYAPLNEDLARQYRTATNGLVDAFQNAGVRVVLGSPGVVDSQTFRGDPEKAAMYNKTLAAERDMVKQIAAERNVAFADVYGAMLDVMVKAKAKYGQNYPVAGGDGVHPGPNGHLVMAYAFLKALGCDGDIGTITANLSSKNATASDGHVIKSFDGDTITVESSRYPFCFVVEPRLEGKLNDPSNVRGILEFFPFNEELNRFKLVLTGAPAGAKVKVTWGTGSKEFSADELAKGINLAGEFLDNPFVEQFRTVDKAVRAQQAFETPMIKSLVHGVKYDLPDEKELLDQVVSVTTKRQKMLSGRAVDAVVPVTHTIKIEVVQ